MQRWYCENEECCASIDEERYQCIGCGRWFCCNCSHVLTAWQACGRVCHACLGVWVRLEDARADSRRGKEGGVYG